MAGLGFRTWSPGEVITASNVQGYLMDQSVLVFADAAERSSQLISPTEGMFCWLVDVDKFQYFNAGEWEDLIVPISGGTSGQALVSNGTSDAAFQDVSSRFVSTAISSKSANYTVTASDINTIIQTTGAASVTITVPDVFEIGDVVQIIREGSGEAVIAAGAGVTDWAGVGVSDPTQDFFIFLEYGAAGVIKTGAGTFRVIGAIDLV